MDSISIYDSMFKGIKTTDKKMVIGEEKWIVCNNVN